MKYFYLFILLFTAGEIFTQVKTTTKKVSFNVSIDEHTIIKDSTGTRIDYREAMKLISAGSHTLDPVHGKDGLLTHFRIRPAAASDAGRRETEIKVDHTAQTAPPVRGQGLKPFSVVSLNGDTLNSTMMKDKILVINYWFSVCRPCQTEIPELNAMMQKFVNHSDIVFIAPTWEKKYLIEKYMEKNPFNYAVCADAAKMIDDMNIKLYPTHLVVDRSGKIFSAYSGGVPGISNLIEKDIMELIKH